MLMRDFSWQDYEFSYKSGFSSLQSSAELAPKKNLLVNLGTKSILGIEDWFPTFDWRFQNRATK